MIETKTLKTSTVLRSNQPESVKEALQDRKGFFGVEGLDDLIPMGMTYDTQVMLQGETGIGKSVLSAQYVYEGLLVGDTVVYVACDEPPQVVRQNMANFRLGSKPYEETGQLIIVDAYSRERSKEKYSITDPSNFDEFFLYQQRLIEKLGGRPVRLVVDSISTIFSTTDTADILQFNNNRLRYLRAANVLTLDNFVLGVLEQRALSGLSHAYPLIVQMSFVQVSGTIQRYIQIGKLRSGQFSATKHQFNIDSRTGLVIAGKWEEE